MSFEPAAEGIGCCWEGQVVLVVTITGLQRWVQPSRTGAHTRTGAVALSQGTSCPVGGECFSPCPIAEIVQS